jgi:hypothetical protein
MWRPKQIMTKEILIGKLNFPQPQKWQLFQHLILIWSCIFYQKTWFIVFFATCFNCLLQLPFFLLLLECMVRLITSLNWWLLMGGI